MNSGVLLVIIQNYFSAPDFKAVFPKNQTGQKEYLAGGGTEPKADVFKKMSAQISSGDLPNMLTLTESMSIRFHDNLSEAGFIPKMKQLGMIIDLSGMNFAEQSGSINLKRLVMHQMLTCSHLLLLSHLNTRWMAGS